jgi:hypothetical protein
MTFINYGFDFFMKNSYNHEVFFIFLWKKLSLFSIKKYFNSLLKKLKKQILEIEIFLYESITPTLYLLLDYISLLTFWLPKHVPRGNQKNTHTRTFFKPTCSKTTTTETEHQDPTTSISEKYKDIFVTRPS